MFMTKNTKKALARSAAKTGRADTTALIVEAAARVAKKTGTPTDRIAGLLAAELGIEQLPRRIWNPAWKSTPLKAFIPATTSEGTTNE